MSNDLLFFLIPGRQVPGTRSGPIVLLLPYSILRAMEWRWRNADQKKGNLVALCSILYVGIIRNYIAILKSTILSTDISFRCLATTLSDSGIACIVL